jgi:hypothetical protein
MNGQENGFDENRAAAEKRRPFEAPFEDRGKQDEQTAALPKSREAVSERDAKDGHRRVEAAGLTVGEGC